MSEYDIILIVNTGAECFSAEIERIDALTAPDMGNASVGNYTE